jgi:hypothetical protein
MLDEWGLEKIDEFRALKKDTKLYKEHDFLEIAELYKQKTKDLTKRIPLSE